MQTANSQVPKCSRVQFLSTSSVVMVVLGTGCLNVVDWLQRSCSCGRSLKKINGRSLWWKLLASFGHIDQTLCSGQTYLLWQLWCIDLCMWQSWVGRFGLTFGLVEWTSMACLRHSFHVLLMQQFHVTLKVIQCCSSSWPGLDDCIEPVWHDGFWQTVNVTLDSLNSCYTLLTHVTICDNWLDRVST